jgi:hypothetical protein
MMISMAHIYIAHQNAGDLLVVAPPYSSLAGLFLGAGLVCWIAGAVLSVVLSGKESAMPRGFLWGVFPLLLALVIGAPLVYVGLLTARTTHVALNADRNHLRVQQTLLSMAFGTREYPLNTVQKAVVGVGNSCVSLRAVMNDGANEPLIRCTDLTGYNEAADAINEFLQSHREGLTQSSR